MVATRQGRRRARPRGGPLAVSRTVGHPARAGQWPVLAAGRSPAGGPDQWTREAARLPSRRARAECSTAPARRRGWRARVTRPRNEPDRVTQAAVARGYTRTCL